MIVSIRHKGLRLYFEDGNRSKLPAVQLQKIKRILSMLDAVTVESDIKAMAMGVHQLKGSYEGFWSVSVSGNYRIIFRFENGDILDVDYIDYH